ncbi:protein of unknown function (DUF1877) [Nocardia amikacinitolerans]|uniref:YfbM family protein n=1 Tax=Nocardia amikacinitolerans TaxID=756689 RepID=UPI0020A60E9F|nr:YfbM family protein [Nocardia amikacinitolerans]MCP2299150.1 protein of unknown function (DUF1877) [Nocardia amikacinitolerans]
MGVILSFTKVTAERLGELVAARAEAGDEVWDIERAKGDPSGYLDKSWDGLRYLLEAAESRVNLFYDGDLIVDEYYAWSPDLVRSTAERLRATPFTALAAHYDPAAMDGANIYPGIWTRDGDEGLGYLRYHYDVLVTFFRDAAKTGSAAIMHFG